MKVWKALGLAGLAGVAATGVIIARDRRQRAELTPEQVRDRLHERLRDVEAAAGRGRADSMRAEVRHRPKALRCRPGSRRP